MSRQVMIVGAFAALLGGGLAGWIAAAPSAEAQVRIQQYTECYAIQIHSFVGEGASGSFGSPRPIQATPIPQGWTVVGTVHAPSAGVVVCQ